MEDIEGIYYFIKDGLKDSWKHYEYAKKAHMHNNIEVVKYHIEEGLYRIERIRVADKLFRKLVMEHSNDLDDLSKLMYEDVIMDAEYLEQRFHKIKL